jgi:hypothetical protein
VAAKPLDVFEETELAIPVQLTGVYKVAPGCDVVIYEGAMPEAEVDRIKVDTEWGKGTGTWTPPKLEGDALVELYCYRISVMGMEFKTLYPVIRVWARQVELEVTDLEGKAMAEAEVRFQHDSMQKTVAKTDAAGKTTWELQKPAPVTVDLHAPWYAKEWLDQEGRTRKVKAELGFLAEFRDPKKPDPKEFHKQFVNVKPDDGHPEYGPTRTVVVGSTEKDPAFVGKTIYLKALYDEINSKRTPEAGQGKPGETKLHELTLDDACQAEFEVPLGHAGGDLVQLSVGATEECEDEYFWIETWRRIDYELISPDFYRLPTVTTGSGKKGGGLPSKTWNLLSPALGDAFVEFKIDTSRRIARGDIPKPELIPSSYMGLGKTGRIRWCRDFDTYDQGDPPKLVKPSGTKLNVLLIDALFAYEAGTRLLTLHLTESAVISRKNGVVRARIDLSAFTDLVLTPNHCKTGDPTLLIDANATWKARPPAGEPKHPGWDSGLPARGTLDASMVKQIDLWTIEVRFPLRSDPGKLFGKDSKTRCGITVAFHVRLAEHVLGVAADGTIVSAISSKGLACAGATIAHEIGHAMGMTILPKGDWINPVPPGLDAPKTVDAGGNFYSTTPDGETAGSDGYRDSHTGPHCAEGIANKKTLTSFGGIYGDCLMYGSGPSIDPPTTSFFCETCVEYMKARKIEDVVGDWNGRKEG